MSNVFTFDGKSFKSVDKGFSDSYYTSLEEAIAARNSSVVGGLTPLAAYRLVPWLYRAVHLRALSVSRMPFDLIDESEQVVTDNPEYKSFMRDFRQLLYLTEASKTITGQSYWWIESNSAGRNLSLDFLRSIFVRPRIQVGEGLVGFDYNDYDDPNKPKLLPLDRVVYFWNINLSSKVRPDVGEAYVALAAASMLYALDSFTAGFFNSGGVKITVFEIPPATSPSDKEEFQSFLNRALSGVRNAFKNIAVRAGVKPTVIGSSIKETEAPELNELQRDNVAVALGVPPSIINGKSSDEANQRSEMLSFYIHTIIPETELIFERANELFFSRLGLKLVTHPEKLEVMQNSQLAQVQAVTQAVGAPVMRRDEGREFLGLPKEEETQPAMDQQASDAIDETDLEQLPTEAMASWRKAALEAVRTGKAPDVPVDIRLPYALVKRIDGELRNAKTTQRVREIFARYWKQTDDSSELKRANDLLERVLKVIEK